MKKHVSVVGAVIVRDGHVLCAQRGHGSSLPGMWEFPGGKIEPGESPEQALRREIDEELRFEVRVGSQVAVTTHEYDFAVITLTTFFCEVLSGEPTLTEHVAAVWLPPEELETLEWAPADIPAVKAIISASRG